MHKYSVFFGANEHDDLSDIVRKSRHGVVVKYTLKKLNLLNCWEDENYRIFIVTFLKHLEPIQFN